MRIQRGFEPHLEFEVRKPQEALQNLTLQKIWSDVKHVKFTSPVSRSPVYPSPVFPLPVFPSPLIVYPAGVRCYILN